jgi:formyltetrahydrofolate deformylase
MIETKPRFVLTITCPDVHGIVAAVTSFIAERGGFFLECQQYGDPDTRTFFMRILFELDGVPLDAFRTAFAPVGDRFAMSWALSDAQARPKVLIGVSRFGHCLYDLLHRWRTGALPVDVAGVFSNHEDMRAITEWHGVPFHHLPVTAATKPEQERAILELVGAHDVSLVVLARYMQVLSPQLCAALSWRCINIHHSFLPSFKGAKPYHQAHARGVKLIGATAHFVTGDLDEGPIIEQAIERIDHDRTAEDLVAIGADIESVVLARAVKWCAERRVLANGAKTVVFK